MTHDDNAPCSTACCSSAASAGAAFLTHSLSLRRARCCRAEAGEQWEVSMSSSIPPLPAKQCWRSETTAPYDLRSSSPAHLNHCVVILIHTRSLSLTSPTPLPSMFCLHPRALSFPCVCYPHLPLPATPTPSSPFLPLSMPAALSRRAYHTQRMHKGPPVTGCDDSAHVTPSLKTGGALHSCRHRAAAMAARPLCRHARAPSCLPPVPLSSHRQTACERERGAPEAAEGQQRQPVNHSSPVAAAAATAACASLQLSAQPWGSMSE